MTTQTDLTAVTTASENIYRQSGPAATQLGAVITALQEDPPNVALALSEAQGAVTNVAYLAFQSAILNEAAASLNTDLNPPPPPPQPLVVGETGSLVATVGIATTLATISVAGGTTPYKYVEDAKFPLPAGLAINGNVLSGTPTVAGSTKVQVDVTDSGGLSNSVAFTITVNPAITPPPPATLPPLGFYGNGGTAADANAIAATLGVKAEGVSTYTAGDTWATIEESTWAQGLCNPLPMYLAVGLTPNDGGLATAAPVGTFETLAKSFNPNTVARPGWEWNGNWFTWGTPNGQSGEVAPSTNTPALYAERFVSCVAELRAGCPSVKIDWCNNSGAGTLAQLQALYNLIGAANIDYIGFDHYDAGTQAANLAAVTPSIQLAAAVSKPIAIGEWGAASNGADDPAFIDFMAMLINNLPLFCKTFNLPVPPGVAYSSLFTDSSNNITNKPNMIAEFPKAFKGS